MSAPTDRRYAETHEWARDNGDDTVSVGITDHAQEALGDIVFIELPNVGDTLSKGSEFGVVESVKAASDLYAPVSGEVTEVNEDLIDAPEMINSSPFEDGWMLKIKLSDAGELDDLLDAEAYARVAEEDA